ncbi:MULTISPECIES: hypothetical protein [Halorussus]|uniref:hypothetical protein n=1 Tax=Halorussus TaxID=1070314 RepID=UPI000E20E7EE|nr:MULTISPECIES: hypothetical protein [Halorussus]NHN59249.1 hypothetical protein [Halorussus sp. JP-T4]
MNRCARATTDPGVGSNDGPFATVVVGKGRTPGNDAEAGGSDDAPPRTVRVRNAAGEPRRLSVAVSRGAEIPVDRTVEFPAEGALELRLTEPADYRVLAGPADGDRTAVAVARSSFEADANPLDVTVLPDGRVETPDVDPVAGCRDPRSETPPTAGRT